MSRFASKFPLISNTYRMVRPYGRRRLLAVFLLLLTQAFFQLVGVGSVYPFLALAADPVAFRASEVGRRAMAVLPPLSDERLLLLAGVFALVMLFASNAVNLISEIGRVSYTRGLGHWLRVRLLSRISNRPYGYFLDRNSGELLKKIVSDVPAYVNGVLLSLLEVMAKSITSIVLIGFLIYMEPMVALGATLFFGVFYVGMFVLLRGLRARISKRLKASQRGISKEATQLLGGIKPAKVHDVTRHFVRRFAAHSDEQAKAAAWIPIIGNGMRYLVEPIAFGGLVVLILVLAGDQRSFAQMVPIIGVMALAGYRLLPAVQGLYGSMNAISTHRHAVDEIEEEFADDPVPRSKRRRRDRDEVATGSVPILSETVEIRDLGFSYPLATSPIFDGLSFRIPAKTSFAIVGRTGSGKSTLVDILLGLHTPDSGSILVDGVPVVPENSHEWRAQIGYVPQEIFLLDDTIAANIAFGVPSGKIDSELLHEAARRAQILDFIEHQLPGGFDALVGERGVRLSGGQRQRIGLARALYRRPRVLILDEATSALDVDTEAALVEALEELHGQLTMIVIAHRLTTIERCERKLSLDRLPSERVGV